MRTHALREIFDAIFYVLKSGCPWRLLRGDLPPWQTVFYHFRKFRLSGLWFLILKALRAAEWKRNSKDPNPSAAIVDSQSVKTTEESAGRNGHEAHRKGYDAHKHVKGRKRHLLVDTLGLPLSVYLTSADVQDRVGARCLLAGLKPFVPRLKKIWADNIYKGPLIEWVRELGWDLEVVSRPKGQKGFVLLPRRWVVERTFAWLHHFKRLLVRYDRRAEIHEAFIVLSCLARLLHKAFDGHSDRFLSAGSHSAEVDIVDADAGSRPVAGRRG